MTASELNRDIKKLLKIQEDPNFEKEFKRLYFADSSFQYMNKKSILIMLRLNLRYRFIPLHSFGINIDLD